MANPMVKDLSIDSIINYSRGNLEFSNRKKQTFRIVFIEKIKFVSFYIVIVKLNLVEK